MKYPIPDVAPNISATASSVNENLRAIVQPAKIEGDAAGRIILNSLSAFTISRVEAFSRYLLSIVITADIVVPKMIQKQPKNMMNIEATLNEGRIFIAYGVSRVTGIALKALINGVRVFRTRFLEPKKAPIDIPAISANKKEIINKDMELLNPSMSCGKYSLKSGGIVLMLLKRKGSNTPNTSVSNTYDIIIPMKITIIPILF